MHQAGANLAKGEPNGKNTKPQRKKKSVITVKFQSS
jgi:hypothetical protein